MKVTICFAILWLFFMVVHQHPLTSMSIHFQKKHLLAASPSPPNHCRHFWCLIHSWTSGGHHFPLHVQDTCLGSSERQILQIYHSWSIGLLPLAVGILGENIEHFGLKIFQQVVDPFLTGLCKKIFGSKNGWLLTEIG